MDPAAICDYIQDHRHYLITSKDSLNRVENKHERQILGRGGEACFWVEADIGLSLVTQMGSSSEGGPDPLAGGEQRDKVGT